MDFNHQAPLSMGFPRQEWSGLPFPSPGDFPDPGMTPWSSVLAGRFFNTVLPRKPLSLISRICHILESNSLGVRFIEKVSSGGGVKMARNRTGRSRSLLQIHRKNNRTVNKVYKTTSDR